MTSAPARQRALTSEVPRTRRFDVSVSDNHMQGASQPAPIPAGRPAEMVPIEHETFDRVVRILVFSLPPAALVVAGLLAWGGTLHWQDLLVLGITYTLTGLGITVG